LGSQASGAENRNDEAKLEVGITAAMIKLPALLSSVRLPASKPNTAPVFNTSLRLPTGGFDEARAIECVAVFCSRMLHKLTTPKFSREWAETIIQRKLLEGPLDFTREVVKEAKAGDEVFHSALMHVYVQINRGGLPEQPGYLDIRTYGDGAILQKPHKYHRSGHDNWVRDAECCALIWYVYHHFRQHGHGISATRKQKPRHANRNPSVISIVVAALARNGVHFKEAHVQENIWNGSRGRLVREELDQEFAPLDNPIS
jgi:hypothetical protein